MSRRNGDRARFQKERKRKMLRRQRVQEFIKAGGPDTPATAVASTPAARKGSPRKAAAPRQATATKAGAAPPAAAAKA
jgi:hypothetical protein